MTSSQIVMMIAIALYLMMMLYIGYRCSKKNKSADDFYLGGRKLGFLVTAMSAEASDMSSYLLMGLPGVAFFCGLADVTWTVIGLAIGTYLNWLIVAKRIRNYSVVADNSITVPDFFSRRYHDQKNILMCFSALIIIIFFVPYTASGFASCGKLFSSLFGVDYMTAMIVSAVIIIAYTTLGGFLAASTTDFVQSIVMTAALITVLGFGIVRAGGLTNVIDNAKALPGYLSMTQTYVKATNSASGYGFLTIISTMAWGLGYFGMPHILLRFMAIENPSKLKTSRRVASVWVVISMFAAVAIGIVGLSLAKNSTIPDPASKAEAETIIVKISDVISQNGVLAALVAGVILAGILAATMSTADSQLLAASSSVSKNLFQGVFHIKLSKKSEMLIARLTLVVMAVIAAFIASDPDSSIFEIVSFAWAGFGAAFGPVVLTALFWRRSNKWGALAGMISGGAMVFIWKFLLNPVGSGDAAHYLLGNNGFTAFLARNSHVFGIYELLPAFLVALLFIVVVSLLTKAPSKEITDEFDTIKAM